MGGKGKLEPGRIVTGLDIGTTKICAVIGQSDEDDQVRVLGMGSHPSKGLRKGVVVDLEAAVDSIEKAVSRAEQMANVEVRNVYVGITGEHMKSLNRETEIELSNPMRGVDKADIQRVQEKAKDISDLSPDFEVLHCFPEEYYCDGLLTENPEDRHCRQLKVNCHIILADITAGQNLMHCISNAGLKPSDILFESVASSHAILNENERDLGVLMIDIGGGTSDLVIYENQRIRHSACIPVGGDDITYDIHHAFKISRKDAENLKKRSGSAYAAQVNPKETLDITGVFDNGPTKLYRRELAEVIQARCEEILELILKNVDSSSFKARNIGGVVLTGGTSLLDHLPELTQRMYDRTVKVKSPQQIKGISGILSSPIYSTGVGLLLYGLRNEKNTRLTKQSVFQRIKSLLQNLIDWYD